MLQFLNQDLELQWAFPAQLMVGVLVLTPGTGGEMRLGRVSRIENSGCTIIKILTNKGEFNGEEVIIKNEDKPSVRVIG